MAGNHLEALVAEWYEFRGYFVRRNVQVGKLLKGGYHCELDIVAFHPEQRSLAHIEPSLDSDSWAKREVRYKKKFEAGRRHIPALFPVSRFPSISIRSPCSSTVAVMRASRWAAEGSCSSATLWVRCGRSSVIAPSAARRFQKSTRCFALCSSRRSTGAATPRLPNQRLQRTAKGRR